MFRIDRSRRSKVLELRRAIPLHVLLSFGVGWGAASAFAMIVGFGRQAAFLAVFVVVLPALVYAFLAGAWFLRLAHGMISQHRH